MAKTLSTPIRPTSRRRGSSDEFWRDLDAVKRIARLAGLSSVPLSTAFLSVGPCPGRWRVYYSLISDVPRNPKRIEPDISSFLGRSTSARTEDDLGTEFERWVDEANDAMNPFAQAGGSVPPAYERINTPELRRFYEERIEEVRANHTPAEIRQLVMRVNSPIEIFPGLPIAAPKPDGTFDNTVSGGVFESKLRDPNGNPHFRAKMAAYAVSAERKTGGQYDYGIVLHAEGPYGPLDAYAYEIDAGDVEGVQQQLNKLRVLVESSWATWPHRRGNRRFPSSWGDLLDRPRPGRAARKRAWRPTGRDSIPCRSAHTECPFLERCWSENKWR